jgi:hypothetical protein
MVTPLKWRAVILAPAGRPSRAAVSYLAGESHAGHGANGAPSDGAKPRPVVDCRRVTFRDPVHLAPMGDARPIPVHRDTSCARSSNSCVTCPFASGRRSRARRDRPCSGRARGDTAGVRLRHLLPPHEGRSVGGIDRQAPCRAAIASRRWPVSRRDFGPGWTAPAASRNAARRRQRPLITPGLPLPCTGTFGPFVAAAPQR